MTYLIIALTSVVSILAFNNAELFNKLKLNTYMAYHKKEWHRLFSHGLLHADWGHLLFNMLTLYFFGDYVEDFLAVLFGNMGKLFYIFLYISAIGVATIPSLIKHKNDQWYNSIGASGAVSAVLFAAILFNPTMSLYIMFIPIPIPGFVFGIAFLAYSHYMGRRGGDNINHEAHFVGAVYGLLLPIIFRPDLVSHFFSYFF